MTNYSDTTERKLCVNTEKKKIPDTDKADIHKFNPEREITDRRAEALISHTHTYLLKYRKGLTTESSIKLEIPDQNKGAKFKIKLPS